MLLAAGSFVADGNQNNVRTKTIKSRQVCLRADIVALDYDFAMCFCIVRDFEEHSNNLLYISKLTAVCASLFSFYLSACLENQKNRTRVIFNKSLGRNPVQFPLRYTL